MFPGQGRRLDGGEAAFPQVPECRYFLAGNCRDGVNCPMSHGDAHPTAGHPAASRQAVPMLGAVAGATEVLTSNTSEVDLDRMTYSEILALEDRAGRCSDSLFTAEDILARFPRFAFKKSGDSDPDCKVCCICLSDYEENEEVLLLPCFHRFHTNCVVNWLTHGKNECPVCKTDPRRTGCSEIIGQ